MPRAANVWTVDELNSILEALYTPLGAECRVGYRAVAEDRGRRDGCETLPIGRAPCAELSCGCAPPAPQDASQPCDNAHVCTRELDSAGPGAGACDWNAPNRNPYSRLGGPDDKGYCTVLSESKTLTNPKFLFLREVGGPECLKRFLDDVILYGEGGPHWGATLIIDQEVPLGAPIRIPREFTLAGVGISGGGYTGAGGRLVFHGDFNGAPAVTFQDGGTGSTIRDLEIVGPGNWVNTGGVKVGSVHYVPDNQLTPPGRLRLHRVRIIGFGTYGIQGGTNTQSVTIDSCQIVGNYVNLQLVRRCDSWRIRNTIINLAVTWGIEIGATVYIDGKKYEGSLVDTVISGCVFSGNKVGALRVLGGGASAPRPGQPPISTTGVFVIGNGFENNGGVAIKVESANAGVRLVANFFADGEGLLSSGENPLTVMNVSNLETHIGFNAYDLTDSVLDLLNTLRAPITP